MMLSRRTGNREAELTVKTTLVWIEYLLSIKELGPFLWIRADC